MAKKKSKAASRRGTGSTATRASTAKKSKAKTRKVTKKAVVKKATGSRKKKSFSRKKLSAALRLVEPIAEPIRESTAQPTNRITFDEPAPLPVEAQVTTETPGTNGPAKETAKPAGSVAVNSGATSTSTTTPAATSGSSASSIAVQEDHAWVARLEYEQGLQLWNQGIRLRQWGLAFVSITQVVVLSVLRDDLVDMSFSEFGLSVVAVGALFVGWNDERRRAAHHEGLRARLRELESFCSMGLMRAAEIRINDKMVLFSPPSAFRAYYGVIAALWLFIWLSNLWS